MRTICKLLPLPQIYCSLCYRRDHTFENCRTCIKCFNEGHDAKDCGQESQKMEKRFSEVSLQTQKNRVQREYWGSLKVANWRSGVRYIKYFRFKDCRFTRIFGLDVEKSRGVNNDCPATEVVISRWMKPHETQVTYRCLINNSKRIAASDIKHTGQCPANTRRGIDPQTAINDILYILGENNF